MRLLLRNVVVLAALTLPGAAVTQTAQPGGPAAGQAIATFAGGCFWCMEEAYEKLAGVSAVVSSFMGGSVPNPTYKQVSGGSTGHAEVVQVTFDPAKVSYQQLIDWFWVNIDPADASGQFCDKGSEYRSGIFFHGEEQKQIAQSSKEKLQGSGRVKGPIATEITAAGPFYPAEDYHQGYYEKSSARYQYYKYGCGRAARLEQIWGKPTLPPTQ